MALPTTSNVTRPRALGYDVRIESNYYRLIPPLDIRDEATKHPMANQLIQNPEDLDRLSEQVLSLSQVDFSGGEGLDFAHRPDNTDFDKTRFWASKAINVVFGHGDVQKLELEKDFTRIYDQTDFSTVYRQSTQMVEAGGSLFVIGNAGNDYGITRIDDPAGTPTTTSENPDGTTAPIVAIAELDGEVYVNEDNDIWKRDTSGTWSLWSGGAPKRMWGLKGRIISTAIGTTSIFEGDDAGNFTTLHSLGGDEQFLCACDAGAAILAGATNGHVFAFADVDGSLTLRAQTRFDGEEVTALGSNASGIVLIGTRSSDKTRLYMGELGSSYTIQNTQLLREWDIENDGNAALSHIHFTRDAAYFGFEPSDQSEELWKFDVATTGLFLMWKGGGGSAGMTGIETVDNKVFFSTFNHDVLGEQDTYQSSAYLISPLFDHFTAEDKVWAAAKLFGVNFPTNTSAELFYSTNPDAIEDSAHASWTSVKSLTSVDDAEALLSNAQSRWVTFKIELSTSDTSATPQVRGYSARAYPGPGDVTLPLTINCSDRLERRGRKAKTIPGLGEDIYDQLKTLEGAGVEVETLWNNEIFEGTVRSVGHRTPAISSRGSQLLVSQVEFVGRRQ